MSLRQSDTDESSRVFQPIIGPRASEEVVDQIAHAIVTGRIEIGEKLPNVGELSRLTCVSTTTIGEAVRVLADLGVLDVRRGAKGGITVLSSEVPSRALLRASRRHARSFKEVVEARRPLELQIARLAAERATAQDFRELHRTNEILDASSQRREGWAWANYRFHIALGRSAKNALLLHLQEVVAHEMAILVGERTPRDQQDPGITVAEHAAIIEALEQRDTRLVEEAVDQHLREIELLAEPKPRASSHT